MPRLVDGTTETALSNADWVHRAVFSGPASMEKEGPCAIFGSPMTPELLQPDTVIIYAPLDIRPRLEVALNRIRDLAALGPNWDSYGARPLQRDAIVHAIRLLAVVMQSHVSSPEIVPTSSGGLQLEWHRNGAVLEMEVTPERRVEVFLSSPSGETREGPLANQLWRLEDYLDYVRNR